MVAIIEAVGFIAGAIGTYQFGGHYFTPKMEGGSTVRVTVGLVGAGWGGGGGGGGLVVVVVATTAVTYSPSIFLMTWGSS